MISFTLFAVLAYAGACGFLWFSQRGMMYFPTPANDTGSAESVILESHGESLRIFRVGGEQSEALIYFGGNAENVAYSADWFAQVLPGRTVYLANYRGYGGSTGEPSEAALYQDAESVFDFVDGKHDRVAIMGRSLGSGVATYLAARRDTDHLVLVTPFDSMVNVAAGHYPFFPVSLLLSDRYESASRVPDIKAQTLILIAAEDRIIPPARSEALAKAFPPAQVESIVFEDANHNDIESAPGYREALKDFLQCRA